MEKGLVLSLAAAVFAALVFVFLAVPALSKVNYEVQACEIAIEEVCKFEGNTLVVHVNANCCSDELKVVKMDGKYRILEKDYDGILCKCLCARKVVIKNAENLPVEFESWGGEVRELSKFCGWSTFAPCKSDADCKVSGCSSQVCAGADEEIITTCEWKDCYQTKMRCGCFEGRCQWG